ncbi:MAG: SPOR domain-containing protein [Burkholderiaceae bacterium]
MLRLLVLLLVLANGAYFAWSQGYLRGLRLAPLEQGEGQRLAQQIQPGSLRVLSAAEAKALEASAAARARAALAPAATCLQAGVFDEAQARALRPALSAALSTGSWSLEPAPLAGRWIIYMGKYASAPLLEKKRAELREIAVPFTEVALPSLAPGLSLGGYDSLAAADAALAALSTKGVRTAKVVQERAPAAGYRLKLPQAAEGSRAKLEALGALLAGKPLQACPAPAVQAAAAVGSGPGR